MPHPPNFPRNSFSLAVLFLILVTLAGPWTAEAVDLEPPQTFDPICAAAHSDLMEARERRFRARRRAKQARNVYDRCKSELRLGNVYTCRRQLREVKESISFRTRAETEFQEAAIQHRKQCSRDDRDAD